MGKLLLSDIFDHFLMIEGNITTFNTFSIDGTLHKEFFPFGETEESDSPDRMFSYWEAVKPFCYELIKGKKTPLAFRFVFRLSAQNTEKFLTKTKSGFTAMDNAGLFLNIKFEAASLTCTTGISIPQFTLDKTLENEWDLMVKRFFLKHNINFEEL